MRYLVSLFVSAMLVSGCVQELSLKLPPGESLQLTSHSHGTPTVSCTITPNSSQYLALEKWLSNNNGGWQTTPATYVPGTVVSGRGLTFNFIGSLVIVNHSGGQYFHSIEPNGYGFLKCNSIQSVLVEKLIAEYAKVPIRVSPRAIYRYQYKGKEVIHVPALYCCDIPGTLYDVDGKVICHPDGGIGGIGDGKCTDFRATREAGEVLWQDPRITAQ